MTALDFITDLVARGVVFVVDGDRLRVRDPHSATSRGERALITALKPSIRELLRTELPPEQAAKPCPAFTAVAGVSLCCTCAHALPAHFWRMPTCDFFIGTPATDAMCRRCGIPWLEHIGAFRKRDAT